MKNARLVVIASGLIALCVGGLASAAPIYWTNWTTPPSYGSPGSASGTIDLPSGTVNVEYSGEVADRSDTGDWDYPGTYSKPGVVDNTPTPRGVSITLVGGNSIVNTIAFSRPVLDPVMAIQSLGSTDQAEYDFSSSFVIVQQGSGHWGGGSSSLWQVGNTLYGAEGNGIIQFSGEYSSISWTVPDGEDYHMFTVGAPASSVPAPAALLLTAVGTTLFGWLRRRRTV
jgi:hypothetical protein